MSSRGFHVQGSRKDSFILRVTECQSHKPGGLEFDCGNVPVTHCGEYRFFQVRTTYPANLVLRKFVKSVILK